MQKQQIQWIPIDKINPLFEARVSNVFLERMRKINPSLQLMIYFSPLKRYQTKIVIY